MTPEISERAFERALLRHGPDAPERGESEGDLFEPEVPYGVPAPGCNLFAPGAVLSRSIVPIRPPPR